MCYGADGVGFKPPIDLLGTSPGKRPIQVVAKECEINAIGTCGCSIWPASNSISIRRAHLSRDLEAAQVSRGPVRRLGRSEELVAKAMKICDRLTPRRIFPARLMSSFNPDGIWAKAPLQEISEVGIESNLERLRHASLGAIRRRGRLSPCGTRARVAETKASVAGGGSLEMLRTLMGTAR